MASDSGKEAYAAQLKGLQEQVNAASASGPLVDLVASVMSPPAFEEKTPEQLAKMTKEERGAYHKAKLAAAKATAAPAVQEISKADKRAQAREKQEADRKKKEDAKKAVDDSAEALADLKLQGLTEEQAREVLAQLKQAKPEEIDDDDDVEENLLESVRSWISEQKDSTIDKETLRDFNLKVRFQGHVETTPPDHLAAILEVLSFEVFKEKKLENSKQPAAVLKEVQPTFARWACMLDQLYNKCDSLVAADAVVSSVRRGIDTAGGSELAENVGDCVAVGIFMALRDEVEAIADEDLLTGCRRLESQSRVMQGFISHLEEAVEGSDDEEEDD
jgi:hypothetical protein